MTCNSSSQLLSTGKTGALLARHGISGSFRAPKISSFDDHTSVSEETDGSRNTESQSHRAVVINVCHRLFRGYQQTEEIFRRRIDVRWSNRGLSSCGPSQRNRHPHVTFLPCLEVHISGAFQVGNDRQEVLFPSILAAPTTPNFTTLTCSYRSELPQPGLRPDIGARIRALSAEELVSRRERQNIGENTALE